MTGEAQSPFPFDLPPISQPLIDPPRKTVPHAIENFGLRGSVSARLAGDYAANQIGCDQVVAKPDSRTARVYAPRIQKRMETVFQEVGLKVDPLQTLISEPTDSNVIVYRLKATVEIVHIDKG